MEADPPAGGGGGAAADGVAPHVAAGLAAAAPGEQAPAPLAAAAVAVGEHDLAPMEVLEEHDADQGALAAEELGPAVEEEEGGQLDGDEDDDAEVAVEEEEEGGQLDDDEDDDAEVAVEEEGGQLDDDEDDDAEVAVEEEEGGQLDDDEDDDAEVAVEGEQGQGPLHGVLPHAGAAHPQPQQLGPLALAPQENQPLGGGDGDNGDEQVELQEEEEEEIAALVPLVPAPAPAAASTQIDGLYWWLAGITALVLGAVLAVELGVNIPTWLTTLKEMTPKKWKVALLLAAGDITSLGLTYTPAWKFRAIWRREEGAGVGAGLATMLPLVAAFINAGVWVFYGATVAGQNWSVMIINGAGMVFQVLYVTVFCGRSEAPWRHKLLVLMLGAGAGVVIAIVDYFLLHLALGFEMDSAIGWSGAATSITTYAFGCAVNLSGAARDRGARGVPTQAWASLANASIWSVCGAVTQDWRMLTPNLVGILGFIVQAGQIVYLRCHRPQLEEDEDELQRRLLDSTV